MNTNNNLIQNFREVYDSKGEEGLYRAVVREAKKTRGCSNTGTDSKTVKTIKRRGREIYLLPLGSCLDSIRTIHEEIVPRIQNPKEGRTYKIFYRDDISRWLFLLGQNTFPTDEINNPLLSYVTVLGYVLGENERIPTKYLNGTKYSQSYIDRLSSKGIEEETIYLAMAIDVLTGVKDKSEKSKRIEELSRTLNLNPGELNFIISKYEVEPERKREEVSYAIKLLKETPTNKVQERLERILDGDPRRVNVLALIPEKYKKIFYKI